MNRIVVAIVGLMCLAVVAAHAGDKSSANDPQAGPPGKPVEFVHIAGGKFAMRADNGSDPETPAREVAIDAFEISKAPVTVEQYAQCVAKGKCGAPGTGDYCNWGREDRRRHPINCVNWKDANGFAAFADARLPSEAEYEYAATSRGKMRPYPWGEGEVTCDKAVMYGNGGYGCGGDGTMPVCSKPKGNTEQGLCDVVGNVLQWVEDTWQDAGSNRILRGSAFYFKDSGTLRTDYRRAGGPEFRSVSVGFRLAKGRGGSRFISKGDGVVRPVKKQERERDKSKSKLKGAIVDKNIRANKPDEPGEAGEFVLIRGGKFMMGSGVPSNTYGTYITPLTYSSMGPIHAVSVDSFYLGRTPVTVEQYARCVAKGKCRAPSAFFTRVHICNWGKKDRQRHPINCVDWNDANDFAAFAGARLPSEAEYEYAATSRGKKRPHPWGEEEATCDRAVMSVRLTAGSSPTHGCGTGTTMPVCSKTRGNTEQGLCDMAGNVSQWLADVYHKSYVGAPTDGSAWRGATIAAGSSLVMRGGDFMSPHDVYLRNDYRFASLPQIASPQTGFRLARSRRPTLDAAVAQPRLEYDAPGTGDGE